MARHFNFYNKLYVITESAISKDRSNESVVREAIKGGADVIQLREKGWEKYQIKEEAIKLLKICRENNVLFILNDYVDIALEIGADGVHLGQDDMSVEEAREMCGDELTIGISTHSIEQAIDADQQDVDYIAIGPIYKTRAKDLELGIEIIKPVLDCIQKPLIAIGGINNDNIDEVLSQGVNNIAVISAVVSADNIKEAASELAEKIKGRE
jgi:thiamine-phosphate pyrophosphorylase